MYKTGFLYILVLCGFSLFGFCGLAVLGLCLISVCLCLELWFRVCGLAIPVFAVVCGSRLEFWVWIVVRWNFCGISLRGFSWLRLGFRGLFGFLILF